MMIDSLPAVPTLLALATAGALLSGCAADGQPGPTRATPTLQQATASELAAENDERSQERDVLRVRRRIESRGAAFPCDQLPTTRSGGWDNWLDAWCQWHQGDWSATRRAALRALPHFESTGAVRRQIELHLLAALAAAHEYPDPAKASAHARRAVRLTTRSTSTPSIR